MDQGQRCAMMDQRQEVVDVGEGGHDRIWEVGIGIFELVSGAWQHKYENADLLEGNGRFRDLEDCKGS